MYSFRGQRKEPPKYIIKNVRVKLVFLVSGFETALRKHISQFKNMLKAKRKQPSQGSDILIELEWEGVHCTEGTSWAKAWERESLYNVWGIVNIQTKKLHLLSSRFSFSILSSGSNCNIGIEVSNSDTVLASPVLQNILKIFPMVCRDQELLVLRDFLASTSFLPVSVVQNFTCK